MERADSRVGMALSIMTFVLLSEVRDLFCRSGLLNSLNSNLSVTVSNGLNSLSSYSCIAISSYNFGLCDYRVSVNSLFFLVAIASNECYAEKNSKRQNYFLHVSKNLK